jgi:transcriptional regulator with XRE-family HTH domain
MDKTLITKGKRTMQKSIGYIVCRAREKKGLSREQLAKAIKISQAYISFVERDRPVWLSKKLVTSLSKRLRVTIPTTLVEKHNKAYKRYLKKRAA